LGLGRVAEAIPILRETVEGFWRTYGPTLPQTAAPAYELIHILQEVRDYTALRDLLERWLREILAMPVETDPYLRNLRTARLSDLAHKLSRLPEPITIDVDLAIHAAEEAGRLSDGKAGCVTLAFLYSRAGRIDLAVQAIKKAKARPDWADIEDDYCWLVEAFILARRGGLAEARRLYDQARSRPNPTAFGQESYQGLQQSVETLIAPKSPPERSKKGTPPRPARRP
jgi:tetratricopeptide (TPR) repeat protein